MAKKPTCEELEQRIRELELNFYRYRKAGEALRSAYQGLRAVFDAIPWRINVVDLDFNITDVNEYLVKSFGFPDRESVIGRKCYEVLKGRGSVCPDCAVAETFRTGKLGFRRTDSQDEEQTGGRSFEIFACPLSDENGRCTGAIEFTRDITEFNRLEDERRNMKARLRVLRSLSRMVDADYQSLCDKVLDELLAMTRSRYAFYGLLNRDETVLTAYSWSRDVLSSCAVKEKIFGFPLDKGGLWTVAVRERKSLIVNDYDAWHPAKRGTPEGHVRLRRLLVVPIFMGERIVALTAVANKESDYTEDDVRQIEAFCTPVQTIIARRRAENELREHLDVLGARMRERAAMLEEEIIRRRETEAALRKSEEDKTNILQTMSELVVYTDRDMKIIWANRAACESLGMQPDELVGKYCYSEWFERSEQCPFCPAGEIFKTGKPAEGQTRSPDGRQWHFRGYPVKDENGDVTGIVEVVEEITDKRRAEQALRSQLELEKLVASISAGFINLAPEQIDGGINRALETIGIFFGVDRSYLFLLRDNGEKMDNTHEWCAEGVEPQINNLKGLSVDIIPWWMEKLRRFEDIYIPRVADLPPEADVEKNILLEQDIRSLVAVPVAYEGSLLGFIGFDSVRHERQWPEEVIMLLNLIAEIFANALARRRAIQEKADLEAQLFKAQKMEAIGTLAGGVAHDFNNLLMVIQGHVSLMLLDADFQARNREHLERIREAVKSGADLTKQLLGFARGGKYQTMPTDVNQLVERSAEMFGRARKEIKIYKKYHPDIHTVEVDRGQMEQVFMNLFINAWQAMPGGGDLYIETDNVALEEDYTRPFGVSPGDFVKISVADTGKGMDKATMERIFEPFFTTKEMGRGTGLGLASAYGIIRNHGGIIDVQSEKGRGTTFDVYLPASGRSVKEGKKEKTATMVKGTGTILIVDDEEMILDVGQAILKSTGYKVLRAGSGSEALRLYRQHGNEIDLVLLDMIMPDMNGGEVYDRIKDIDPGARVLLSSGYSIDGQAAGILERGCDDFIQKPFDPDELSAKISEILNRG